MRHWRACAIAVVNSLACATAQAATYTVTTVADSGPGSLREKLTRANALPGADTIRFGVSGSIVLASNLPDITDSLTIDGTGASIVISGNSTFRIFRFLARGGQSLTLIRLNLAKGWDARRGGAVHFAGPGSSLPPPYPDPRSVLSIIDSTLTGNVAGDWGGAVSVRQMATLIVSGSTFHANTASSAGAIDIADSPQTSGIAHSITNSTFTSNVAHGIGYDCSTLPICGGGAIFNNGTRDSSLTITNSTFHLNRALGDSAGGSALWVKSGGTYRLSNTLVSAASEMAACHRHVTPGVPDSAGVIVDDGGNLSSDASCRFTSASSVNSVDPLLGSLRNNGGPSMTVAPLTGSPAIDTGVNALAVGPGGVPLATDQRGYARVAGSSVDRGAYEVAGPLDLTGFFPPISNLPIVNVTWAGSLVPVRVGLNGYQGLAVLAKDYPTSNPVACGNGPFVAVAELASTGGGTLTYDNKTQYYQYVLETQAAWKGSCRKVSFKFIDGSAIDAYFRFR